MRRQAPGPDRPRPPETETGRPVRVAGLRAVSALFEIAPGRVERLYFDERSKTLVGAFCRELARARKPYRLVDAAELERVAGTALHGGVVAVARPRPIAAFDPEAARAWAETGRPLLLLDGIGNPHNLGAIIRTAAFFGLERVVLSDHPAQAGPSDASYRVAEGGFEHVALFRARGLPEQLRRLRGPYRVVGTALGQGIPLEAPGDGPPVALVLGNEEEGLGPATLAACDAVVTIAGAGKVQSLNVAATAAILIHALCRPAGM